MQIWFKFQWILLEIKCTSVFFNGVPNILVHKSNRSLLENDAFEFLCSTHFQVVSVNKQQEHSLKTAIE